MDHPTPRSTMVDALLAATPLLNGQALARESLEALPDDALQRTYERWERIRAWAADHQELLARYSVPDDRMDRHRDAVRTHLAALDALGAQPRDLGSA